MTHLPLDGVQSIHADINEDGSLAHIAESLKGADSCHAAEGAHIVQRIVTDGDGAAEQGDDAAETHEVSAQV